MNKPPLARIELVQTWYHAQWNIYDSDGMMYAHVFSEQAATEIFTAVNLARAQQPVEEKKDEAGKD
jgi:hypothetical protein